jgi:hypothetical protein
MGSQNKPTENVGPEKAKTVKEYKGKHIWAGRKRDEEV